MNKLLNFNPEPFETEAELEGAFQEYEFADNDSEQESKFRVTRSRGRSPYSRRGSVRRQRSSTTGQPPLPAYRTKSRLPLIPLKLPHLRLPIFPFGPYTWPSSPFPDDRYPSSSPGPGGPSGEPGAPPEQEPAGLPSAHVRQMQQCLNQFLGLRLPLDGIVDTATRNAVRLFQERRGLPITGLLGPETERALVENCQFERDTMPVSETESEVRTGIRRRRPGHPRRGVPVTTPSALPVFDSLAFREKIVQIANQELARWSNGAVKETDPRIRQLIQDYWKTGTGNNYSAAQLGDPAFHNDHPWSAAFISWVMRTAGAGNVFRYASAHAVYIKWAKDNRLANNDSPFKAYRLSELAPQVGDLVCKRRAGSGATYDNIQPGMKTHCDIVTAVRSGSISAVGGNVNNSVAQKTLRTNAQGLLTAPDYFAIIRIGDIAPAKLAAIPSTPTALPTLVKQESTPYGNTLYVNIDLGIVDKFGIRAAPLTGIFVPNGYVPGTTVDLILYLHGHKGEAIRRQAIDQYWNSKRFPYASFRESTHASGRNVVLVAPSLGAHSEAKNLLKPGGLDAYLNQVLAVFRAYGPQSRANTTYTLGNFILACHSGGGWPMRQLAGGRDRALAQLRECWGFDCTYNTGDDTFWAGWARSRPNNKIYIYHISGSQTSPRAESLRRMNVPNAIVQPSREKRHNYVPIAYWRERIEVASFLRARSNNLGTPATTFKHELHTTQLEFPQLRWMGEASDLQSFDSSNAIKQNRRFAESLGWRKHVDKVVALLGFTNMTPAEQPFAAAVARWQRSHGLKADGVIGPNTWRRMQVALSLKPNVPPQRRGPQALCPPPPGMSDAERTALALTTRFETGAPYGCVVSATDGISMGMLQWNLLAGTLQDKLAQFERQTGRLQQFFGAETDRVRHLIALRGKRQLHEQAVQEAKTEGLASRWRDPLLRLCADPEFCAVLMADVLGRMKRARIATRRLGFKTIRGLCMLFDIEVGDGYGKKNSKLTAFADRVKRRESELGRSLDEQEKLVEIADQAAKYAGKWEAERRARRMLIAKGTGRYRSSNWNLDRDFPNLSNAWVA